jgi:hypothetical protein
MGGWRSRGNIREVNSGVKLSGVEAWIVLDFEVMVWAGTAMWTVNDSFPAEIRASMIDTQIPIPKIPKKKKTPWPANIRAPVRS